MSFRQRNYSHEPVCMNAQFLRLNRYVTSDVPVPYFDELASKLQVLQIKQIRQCDLTVQVVLISAPSPSPLFVITSPTHPAGRQVGCSQHKQIQASKPE